MVLSSCARSARPGIADGCGLPQRLPRAFCGRSPLGMSRSQLRACGVGYRASLGDGWAAATCVPARSRWPRTPRQLAALPPPAAIAAGEGLGEGSKGGAREGEDRREAPPPPTQPRRAHSGHALGRIVVMPLRRRSCSCGGRLQQSVASFAQGTSWTQAAIARDMSRYLSHSTRRRLQVSHR